MATMNHPPPCIFWDQWNGEKMNFLEHFHQPQQLKCLHQGATFVPLCVPILSSQPCKVTIYSRHAIASVRDIKIAEALLILCLAYYTMKRVRCCWNWGVRAFRYRDMGGVFHEHILCIFHYGLQRCFTKRLNESYLMNFFYYYCQ